MAQSFEERMLDAIERDDLKAFDALAEEVKPGGRRMGRFPILSVLYLFNARKILSAYEDKFLRYSVWEPLHEPASLSQAFAQKAGKCLRLYFDEVVSPLEMLFILDKVKKAAKLYPEVRPSEAVKDRLKSIYYIKYSLGVSFKGRTMSVERRPLNRREKKRLFAAAIALLLAVAIIIAAPVTATALLPDLANGEVTKLSHIDFASQNVYTLKKDIVIPDDYYVNEVKCTIKGEGHKLIFGKGALFNSFGGKFSDMEIVTSGTPVFNVCTSAAEITDLTINVNAEAETKADGAFVTLKNRGLFDGVTLNVTGGLVAVSDSESGEDETSDLSFGGMVLSNENTLGADSRIIYGKIINCNVNYIDFKLKGELAANASFGGIVGENFGIVQDCVVRGDITADTFDIGGACYYNAYMMTRVTNEANLSQTAADEDWSPIVGGIILENAGAAEECVNLGDLSATGQGGAILGGIAARSYGRSDYCLSRGNLNAKSEYAYVGGIVGISMVAADTERRSVWIGIVDHCASEVAINAELGEKTSYVGGIVGYVGEQLFDVYWGGAVTNCAFLGNMTANANYVGGVVGVCGANIYEKNSYLLSDGTEANNFLGNLYAKKGDIDAFGAAETVTSIPDSTDPSLEPQVEYAYLAVNDKGASAATAHDIRNSALYKDIMTRLGL